MHSNDFFLPTNVFLSIWSNMFFHLDKVNYFLLIYCLRLCTSSSI